MKGHLSKLERRDIKHFRETVRCVLTLTQVVKGPPLHPLPQRGCFLAQIPEVDISVSLHTCHNTDTADIVHT